MSVYSENMEITNACKKLGLLDFVAFACNSFIDIAKGVTK